LDELIGFLKGCGDRLFQKDVDPSKQAIFGDGMMQGGGDCNGHGLNTFEEFGVMGKGLGSVSSGNLCGPGGVDIYHPNQFNPSHLGVFFHMELAKIPDPNHTYFDFFHLTTDPPL
jgi:hypothetical protein